jgi:hypothetical protein
MIYKIMRLDGGAHAASETIHQSHVAGGHQRQYWSALPPVTLTTRGT